VRRDEESEGWGPIPDDRLRRALREVCRDVRTAGELAREATCGCALSPDIRTAIRQACLMRVFRLRRFFYGARQPGEVVAADFFDEREEWSRVRPRPGVHLERWLDDLKNHVDGRLPADDRDQVPPEAWPLSGFVSSLSRAYDRFTEALPPERAVWLEARGRD